MMKGISRLPRPDAALQLRLKNRSRTLLWKLLRAFFLIGFCFVILYPVLMMLSKAFMSREDLYDRSVLLLPRSFTLDNVKTAIKQLDYWSMEIFSETTVKYCFMIILTTSMIKMNLH